MAKDESLDEKGEGDLYSPEAQIDEDPSDVAKVEERYHERPAGSDNGDLPEGAEQADQEVLDHICELLTMRPHLAAPLSDWMIPDMTPAPSRAITVARYTGELKNFDPSKGFGFISCPELKEHYGVDVWVHGAQVGRHQVGEIVNFACLLGKECKPQGFDLVAIDSRYTNEVSEPRAVGSWASAAAFWGAKSGGKGWGGDGWWDDVRDVRDFAGKGTPKGSPKGTTLRVTPGSNFRNVVPATTTRGSTVVPASGQWSSPKGGGGPASGAKAASKGMSVMAVQPAQHRHRGTVVSYFPEKGFGFIDCAEIQAQFGFNTWVHSKQLLNFQVGDHVTFAMTLNWEGKPQAIDLQRASTGSSSGGKGASRAAATTLLGRAAAAAAATAGADAGGVERYTGTVASFMPDKGYGFIECDIIKQIYGLDTWVHHKQIQGFQVGDAVTFTMTHNKTGQPQAIDLAADTAPKRRRL